MDRLTKISIVLAQPFADASHKKSVAEQIYYISPLIDEVTFEDDQILLSMSAQFQGDVDQIRESVTDLVEVVASADRGGDQVLKSTEFAMSPPAAPLEELIASGQVHFNSDGIPVFEGDFKKLMDRLDEVFFNYALEIGCVEQAYPTTVPTMSLIENGYLKSFPQHALLVGSFHQDLASLRAISDRPEEYQTVEAVDSLVDRHVQVLAPTVCYHCFERFRESQVDQRHSLVTAIGKCHRHEGRNMTGLTRLRTYTMREVIYFGEMDFVVGWQEAILAWVTNLFNRLRITHRVVAASDPFFATGASRKKDYQRVFRLKYEVQAIVPQTGEWVSVASFNNHQQSLTSSYKISGTLDDKPLHSGCFGVGYERLAFCIVSQSGLTSNKWPEGLWA